MFRPLSLTLNVTVPHKQLPFAMIVDSGEVMGAV